MIQTDVHVHIPKRVRHIPTGMMHTVVGLGPDAGHPHQPEVITWGDPRPEENLGGETWCGPLALFQREFQAV